MKKAYYLIVSLSLFLFPSCVVQPEISTTEQHSKEQISLSLPGTYKITRKPSQYSGSPKINEARLTLNADGSYVTSPNPDESYLYLPPDAGNWRVESTRAVGSATHEVWSVRFESHHGEEATAYCLGRELPPRLQMIHRDQEGPSAANLIMDKID